MTKFRAIQLSVLLIRLNTLSPVDMNLELQSNSKNKGAKN